MRRRFTAFAALLVLGAITAPWVSAQIFDVTVREINAIPQDSIDALNAAGVTLDDPRIAIRDPQSPLHDLRPTVPDPRSQLRDPRPPI